GFAAVKVTGWLNLAHGVDAWRQAFELVEAVGVGLRRCDDFAAGVQQLDNDTGDGRLAFIERAVAVEIGVHAAANARRLKLAEVVVDGVFVRANDDLMDLVARIDGNAAGATRRVDAIEVARR